MTIQQAQEIVDQYESVLAEMAHQKGLARRESRLPCSKHRISIACRLVLAQAIKDQPLSDGLKSRLESAFVALAQFQPDRKAMRINSLHQKVANASEADWAEYTAFIKDITNPVRARDLKCFLDEVTALTSDDPCFWQKVHSLIGPNNGYPEGCSWFQRVIERCRSLMS